MFLQTCSGQMKENKPTLPLHLAFHVSLILIISRCFSRVPRGKFFAKASTAFFVSLNLDKFYISLFDASSDEVVSIRNVLRSSMHLRAL